MAEIQITLNGENKIISGVLTIQNLLTDLGLDPAVVVVEHNRCIVAREKFFQQEIKTGDTVEVLRFLGGG